MDKFTVTSLGTLTILLISLSSQVSGEGPICPMVADIVLILDETTSVVAAPGGYDNWNKVINGFALGLAQSFDIGPNGTQMAVIKFSSTATPAIYFNQSTDYDRLAANIIRLSINGGETNMAAALRQTRTVMFSPSNGARANVDRIAIMVTDGIANREAPQTLPEAELTKQAGIELYTVGITPQVDPNQLQAIASRPVETHFFYVDVFSKLPLIVRDVVANVCSIITTTSTKPIITTTIPTTTFTTTSTTTTKPTNTNRSTTTRISTQSSSGASKTAVAEYWWFCVVFVIGAVSSSLSLPSPPFSFFLPFITFSSNDF